MNSNLKAFLACLVGVIAVFLFTTQCPRKEKEESVVNIEKVHDFSDSVVSLVQTIILARDSIRTQQELIRIQAGIIASKSKSTPRIKDLQAKILLAVPDSSKPERFNEKAIDSLIEVSEEKERMLDCVNLMNHDLFKSIEASDSLENKKDSLNQGLIVKLNTVVDSLKDDGGRKEKRGYRKGLKHGFAAGTIFGIGVAIVVK